MKYEIGQEVIIANENPYRVFYKFETIVNITDSFIIVESGAKFVKSKNSTKLKKYLGSGSRSYNKAPTIFLYPKEKEIIKRLDKAIKAIENKY